MNLKLHEETALRMGRFWGIWEVVMYLRALGVVVEQGVSGGSLKEAVVMQQYESIRC
jgi:hypothetical protein